MRNSVEITRGYQFRYMILRHFIAVGSILLFEWVLFVFFAMPVVKYILSGGCTLAYGGILYSAASKLAKFDKKPYTPLKPERKWGILWGLAISAMVALCMLLYYCSQFVPSFGGWLVLLFYLMTGPYFGFLIDAGGVIPLYAAVLMLGVPVLSCSLGYIAGSSDFVLAEKLDDLTFEKNEDEQ